MEPPENPTDNLRTTADRLSDVSPLVWLVLGLAAVAIFTVAILEFGSSMNL